MNKKAENDIGIGILITVAITVIVGAVLMVAIAESVGKSTTTFQRDNDSFNSSANGTAKTIATGIKSVSSVVVWNYTNGTAVIGHRLMVEDEDFKILNNQIVNGAEVARIVPYNATMAAARWNVTYLGEPDTYISSGGTRSVVNLILIFFAIGIAVVALIPATREKIIESIGKMK